MKRSYNISQVRPSRRWGAVLALLLCAAGTIWTGCDISALDEGIGLIVDYSPSGATVAGQVFDANTQAPIEDESVTIRFSGPDAARVIDIDGEVIEELTVPEISLFNFNLDGDEPSAEDPATIVLTISAPGYISTSERLIVDSPDHSFTASLTNVEDTPSGVKAQTEQVTTRGGAPTEDVIVRTDAEDNTGAQAGLRIPEGTVMRTADGSPLSGEVTSTVVYYSNQNDNARSAFPGGFMGVEVTENEDGEDTVGSFVTAGFAAIEVTDQQGQRARQFDGPIEINIDVPAGTINPETNQPVKSGDMIPVYSFDEESGEWTFEGRTEASVARASSSAKSRGGLGVSFTTQHLTYWNLDWWWGNRCSVAGRHDFNGMPAGWTGLLWWELRNAESGRLFKRGAHTRGNFLQLWNAPRDRSMTFELIDRETGATLAQGPIDDLCNDQTWDVDVTENSDRVTLDVHATIVCDADQEIRPSNISAMYYLPAARLYYSATLKQGQATLPNLFEGETYRFLIRLKNGWERRSLRIEQSGSPGDEVVVRRVNDSTFRADVTVTDDDGSIC
jgi:hypothetical protein